MRGTHGWAEVSRERKREIIQAIAANRPTRGPVHVELDLTDRCNVACYFCNQQDLRTKESIPLPKLTDLIDELVEGGLKSVRLSGGGDPLFHRDVLNVLDYLAQKNVVVDNLTTNGVALNSDVARRLVDNKAREVIFSLNAADAADYARMMQVKPALFEKVLENIRNLIAIRGDSIYPSIVVQFLLDKQNMHRLVDMYELGRSLQADRIAVNAVLEIPRERTDAKRLLTEKDCERVRPVLEEVLRQDRDARLLQIDFALDGWNAMLAAARSSADYAPVAWFPTAPSFQEANGGCFFAWYTATIVGNGNIYPCCLLMKPDYKPLGNVLEGQFADHWNGPAFGTMRSEMREVLLNGSTMLYRPGRFERLDKACIEPHYCWLKNMYFRGDEAFYHELGQALDQARRREVRWIGTPTQMRRALEGFAIASPRFRRAFDLLRRLTLPARIWLKRHLGWNVSGAAIQKS